MSTRLESVIQNKRCCGCGACVQSCPAESIVFRSDDAGFLYPEIDKETCLSCGICDIVCPVLNVVSAETPLNQYAAFSNRDDVRQNSSSGGIFTLLSEAIISGEGGVVFGAEFDDNWNVRHSYCEDIDGLKRFRGSKYVQSQIGDSFVKVRDFLNQGRSVLFSGTPCQISGLKLFLKKDYPNLITVEVVCHGVPSPQVWKDYLTSIDDLDNISAFSFRDKTKHGWRCYSYKLTKTNGQTQYYYYGENCYSDAFLGNLTIRQSCFACPSKLNNSRADLTIGDFWGIERVYPDMDDDKGCSVVIIHTEKGQGLFEKILCYFIETKLEDVIAGNPSLVDSPQKPVGYDCFWQEYHIKGVDSLSCFRTNKPTLIKRASLFLGRICRSAFLIICQHSVRIRG